MLSTTWTPLAVSSEAREWSAPAWRMVEVQHLASTMKIVDDAAEQDLLEMLLESSKPPQPAGVAGLDYLLATPFRYNPHRSGSRFRSVTDPGVFYGAETVRTVCAELGYWRWKFLQDAVDLERIEPVAHTAFKVSLATRVVDLRKPPFSADLGAWQHPTDYSATQHFARVAREAGMGGIIYQSVRDPESGWCVAVLDPAAFSSPRPDPVKQTWWLAVQQDAVIWRRDSERLEFAADAWQTALKGKGKTDAPDPVGTGHQSAGNQEVAFHRLCGAGDESGAGVGAGAYAA
ncbi:RES family NAD+ phosphorylase [Marinospirillum alkaliphilum]|uniref:RES domain-containing protein n=1 Tax=Marinospirillum alkaliphilum DSM 21637 TaxID=1122209 RepID=A0A1K1XS79_9GAMM|nr:RES family NAD+ phosphorylase [Marinospirillum alkaliphilum]SFX51892.1 RES domain-containing protein [Marinospirillum alkaliphilum DSM 21637]